VEYAAMFDLGDEELTGRILDCSAGVSSFVAEAGERGCEAIAVDPAFSLGRSRLAELGRDDLDRGAAIAGQHPDRFTWAWYGDPARRSMLRKAALARCLTDLVSHPHRYVAAALPQLPFPDNAFDLAVCSHLLFTWADQLGREWHAAALKELTRVAREVRIFPTVVQGRGEPVPFWSELMSDLARAGLGAEEREVPYEFQVGANRMLVVQR
jgi:SAM-dependent methyltransferase